MAYTVWRVGVSAEAGRAMPPPAGCTKWKVLWAVVAWARLPPPVQASTPAGAPGVPQKASGRGRTAPPTFSKNTPGRSAPAGCRQQAVRAGQTGRSGQGA